MIRPSLRLFLFLALTVAAAHAADGLSFNAGNASVTLDVASPHAFRLHIAYARAANPNFSGPDASIYFTPSAPGPLPAVTNISDASTMGIKTSFGSLQVDTKTAKWRMLDANGDVLADWAPLSAPYDMHVNGPIVNTAVGASSVSSHIYGSGTLPAIGALTQVKSGERMGNGTAILPQYWNSAGYGVLVAGSEGDHPAQWERMQDGSVDWTISGSSADLYLMPASSLGEWLRDYSELTGFAPVPPRWAFGYMQSRWGWESRAYIDDTLAHFRKDALPVDAFIFDFEWYTQEPDYAVPPQGDPKFVDFGWNPALFPDPANQIAAWLKDGLHVIGIRKPRIGNAQALAEARAKGWIFAGDPDDTYEGQNTRGRNLDFSQKAVRDYWAENNRKFLEAGMAGFWNDEGELTYTKYSYWNLTETLLLRQVRPGERFFSLNRSFLPGMQRFGAAMWTGDINGDWPTLARTPGELLSLGLSGLPYTTCDIGGFAGKAPAELVVRWMEAGVFFPLMRSHSTRGDMPHFPWLYGTEAENAIRQALDMRYRLIPYYYSLAHETAETGEPIMRPLVMEYPHDSAVAGITDEWLMGHDLLAAPVLTAGGKRTVYLPKDVDAASRPGANAWSGSWFPLFGKSLAVEGGTTVSESVALDQIPVYVRAGTILPLGPIVQYTGQPTREPLEVRVYPGRDATFTLVEDDGTTMAYASGAVRRTMFVWDERKQKLSWKVMGAYAGNNVFTAMKVVLLCDAGERVQSAELGKDGALNFK